MLYEVITGLAACTQAGSDLVKPYIDECIAKAKLFKDLVDCIDDNKAHMPSVEALLKEAKELDK